MSNSLNVATPIQRRIPAGRQPERDELERLSSPSLYHMSSTQTGEWSTEWQITEDYNRGSREYAEELNRPSELFGIRTFTLADWCGKTVLDLGAGGHDRFGQEARSIGVRVISLNPALKEATERARLNWSSAPRHTSPERLAALGQALSLGDESVDCVVSVFAVPHYLHNVNTTLFDDATILDEYTPTVRDQDTMLITQALGEIARILKPGGKAYLKDSHRGKKQTRFINPYSPSDGTEVLEALDSLKGVTSQVFTRENIVQIGAKAIYASTERTIVMSKDVI